MIKSESESFSKSVLQKVFYLCCFIYVFYGFSILWTYFEHEISAKIFFNKMFAASFYFVFVNSIFMWIVWRRLQKISNEVIGINGDNNKQKNNANKKLLFYKKVHLVLGFFTLLFFVLSILI
jgi:hypothetical protein